MVEAQKDEDLNHTIASDSNNDVSSGIADEEMMVGFEEESKVGQGSELEQMAATKPKDIHKPSLNGQEGTTDSNEEKKPAQVPESQPIQTKSQVHVHNLPNVEENGIILQHLKATNPTLAKFDEEVPLDISNPQQ